MAGFDLKPRIAIGAVSQIQEGQVLNSAIISLIDTHFDLEGITSADIVIKGGGSGPNASPFTFSMENIVEST